MEGPLSKWTNMMKGYQPRWFALDDVNGLLSYYTSQEKLVKGDRRGCIRLKGCILAIEDEYDTTFTISADGKVFHCKAHNYEDRDKWIRCLEKTIQKHSHRSRPHVSCLKKHDVTATIEDFNKKLTETDSYLQILINRSKIIDKKIEDAKSDDEKEKLNQLKSQTNYLLDSIKHAIVLLQIAKNVKYPINGVLLTHNITQSSDIDRTLVTQQQQQQKQKQQKQQQKHIKTNLPVEKFSPSHGNGKIENDSIVFVEQETLDNEMKDSFNSSSSSLLKSSKKESLVKATVPDVSYASSDDEECEFYDAREESIDVHSPIDKENMTLKHCKSNQDANKQIDYDHLYDTDDDEDLNSMESHGSVISHLISQVKIGMDLTKVALPTFILERRSLLEMYADFFAHPDIFVSIPNCETPQDRMVAVVRWYLSAFHAGRKGSVAKKPYNPVLGETFRCHWNLAGSDSGKSECATCNDGPIPWAKTSDLTFIAEQVSHHPPISAFYAESVDKRIMCCAHIWTKSKFLGLSIGVNNVGIGSIYLLDRDEEYTCTFPSAYGRSILTEPWFEMGGSVEINCQQTGYAAKVEFLTKPFYGGKRHRINAEVFGPPPTKKLIVNITGEWNGQMFAKWGQSNKSELFIDTKTLPIIKKQVRPISEQEEFESRNMWKVVTSALKRQDVHEASSAKYEIEQYQRNLVKERDEKSLQWQNRWFHCIADKWQYNNPLTSRKRF
ncbi:hypothetical protein RDWZM_002670 [Blomia tropicalis]|uniref:Oxysterol-binding protein n=1 Tax=Blomia tropicalis TaxID=40697 RepID=A0A9Q0RRY9_BLOTA|nr:hypothetical protein RDWZM_002670 [Blomia tropicalis]